jgi:hypothetical protein
MLNVPIIIKSLAFLMLISAVILAILWLFRRHGDSIGLNVSGKLKVEERLYISSTKQAVVLSYEGQKYLVIPGAVDTIMQVMEDK